MEDAKTLAAERCVAAGGDPRTVEIVEVDLVPMSYVTNGATRVMVRAVSDLVESQEPVPLGDEILLHTETYSGRCPLEKADKASDYEIVEAVDVESYRPRIEGDLWYVSATDLGFLQDGSGVLGVGSCGEPYPTYLACMELLKNGTPITIRRQDSIKDSELVLVGGFMVITPLPVYVIPQSRSLTVTRARHQFMRNACPGWTSEKPFFLVKRSPQNLDVLIPSSGSRTPYRQSSRHLESNPSTPSFRTK